MKQSENVVGETFKTNCDGDVVVTAKHGKVVNVRFINTGYEREVLLDNLRKGKCKDYTITDRTRTEVTYPNVVMQSNTCGEFTLLEKQGKRCVVQFIKTGYTTTALWENIKNGKIRDPYCVSRYGKGWLGEFEKTTYHKQAMSLWGNMLKRCYCEADTRGYFGKGVSVDFKWLCFANFLEDLPHLENFDLWLNAHNGVGEKYNLDKDFKVKNNKVYSKETCMFLPESFNKSFTTKTNKWASCYE